MTTPRAICLAAVLPDNQLMIVGGYTIGGIQGVISSSLEEYLSLHNVTVLVIILVNYY